MKIWRGAERSAGREACEDGRRWVRIVHFCVRAGRVFAERGGPEGERSERSTTPMRKSGVGRRTVVRMGAYGIADAGVWAA